MTYSSTDNRSRAHRYTLIGVALALTVMLATAAPATAAALPVDAGFMIRSAEGSCTISFVDPRSTYLAYTAEHCHPHGTPTAVNMGPIQIGNYIPQISNEKLDIIAIRLNSGVHGNTVLKTGEPILGSRAPTMGAHVCKYGSRTEQTCGTIKSVDGDSFDATMVADHGDSGGPVYEREDPRHGRGVYLVGTVIAAHSNRPGVILCTSITSITAFLSKTFGPSWQLSAPLPAPTR